MRVAFGNFIRTNGEGIVQDRENDDKMIDRLLEYKATIDQVVTSAFRNDDDFRQTQKESFETFINKRENKPAELIGQS